MWMFSYCQNKMAFHRFRSWESEKGNRLRWWFQLFEIFPIYPIFFFASAPPMLKAHQGKTSVVALFCWEKTPPDAKIDKGVFCTFQLFSNGLVEEKQIPNRFWFGSWNGKCPSSLLLVISHKVHQTHLSIWICLRLPRLPKTHEFIDFPSKHSLFSPGRLCRSFLGPPSFVKYTQKPKIGQPCGLPDGILARVSSWFTRCHHLGVFRDEDTTWTNFSFFKKRLENNQL